MISDAQFFALGVVWVGGWGFVFFTWPEKVCQLFRVRPFSEKRVRLAKVMGGIGLALTFISALSVAIFGLN